MTDRALRRAAASALVSGVVLVTGCGGSSGSEPSMPGMTPAQTKCMDSRYFARHQKFCTEGPGAMYHGPTAP